VTTEEKIIELLTRHQKEGDGIECTTQCIAIQIKKGEWETMTTLADMYKEGKLKPSKRGWVLMRDE
jgi:hypothetical protein